MKGNQRSDRESESNGEGATLNVSFVIFLNHTKDASKLIRNIDHCMRSET